MKKIIIAILVILVAVAIGFALTSGKDKSETNTGNQPANTSPQANEVKGKAACEFITLADAQTLIGENATLSEGSGEPNLATTESVSVDNCTYSSEGATLGDLKQITIQVHHGDSEQVKQAYENYQKEFPGEPVEGLGDTAYYVTGSEQVQVLKGDYWLHVAGGSINAGDEGNKELVIKAAQLAVGKL